MKRGAADTTEQAELKAGPALVQACVPPAPGTPPPTTQPYVAEVLEPTYSINSHMLPNATSNNNIGLLLGGI